MMWNDGHWTPRYPAPTWAGYRDPGEDDGIRYCPECGLSNDDVSWCGSCDSCLDHCQDWMDCVSEWDEPDDGLIPGSALLR